MASVWPAVTVWPALTLTPVTVPETPKFRLACWAGAMVPDVATVCCMVPVVTLTVWVVICSPGAAELLVPSQMPMPAPTATTTTTAATMMFLRLNHFFGAAPASPSTIGTSAVTWSRLAGGGADWEPLDVVPTDSVLTDSPRPGPVGTAGFPPPARARALCRNPAQS